MTKEWTVDHSADEWKVVEWDDYFNPEVRPKFSNYWKAHGEACLLTQSSVSPADYYCKLNQWGRCGRVT